MSHPDRAASRVGRLARTGFTNAEQAAQLLTELDAGPAAADIVDELSRVADPDLGLRALARLADSATDRSALTGALARHQGFRMRLLAVLGGSAALGEWLARHPEAWPDLVDDAMTRVRPTRLGMQAVLLDAVAGKAGREGYDALRVAYRRLLFGLAGRDLVGDVTVDEAAAELADLAAATLAAAYELAVAEVQPPPQMRLAVIAMGKCGGRELNYVSDVDVIFVSEPAPGSDSTAHNAAATAVAAALMRACSEVSAEGTIWPVDASLRPEGKSGPLVRTLASHVGYYERWAHTWEFQALLKAHPVVGDAALGKEYLEAVAPFVWQAAGRDTFVDEIQAMRRRVVDTLPPQEIDREVKLGPGGLRDVEFSVQLLQLVHGRADPSLRSPTTLVALQQLADGGYVGRDDAAQLSAAYRFLRTVEHRLQLQQLRRTHLLPTSQDGLRWLARAMRYRDVESWRSDYDGHVREVRRIHEKLFYRPLLNAVARLSTDQTRLTPEAAMERLQALGFADPASALRHIEALTSGVSRNAAILRTLLPAMLGWFADAADPDAGLLSFRQVSDALGSTPWYLRVLRDEGVTAERLARLLATSKYVADLLARAPETVAILAADEEVRPRDIGVLRGEMVSVARRNDDWEDSVVSARGLRRRELLRIACGDLLGLIDVREVGRALSEVADATLSAALEISRRRIESERGTPLPVRLAIIGMGRLGGLEQGYGSDADVMFVYQPVAGTEDGPECTAAAHEVAQELRRLLALPAPDPPLEVDADLRPEGRQGPLVRSLASYAEYYDRWSSVWEMQALLRAAPVAGDRAIADDFVTMIDPLRYPEGGISDSAVREIRRLKARMEAERLPRGVDPALHIKLGRGGLSDVEWTVQLIQLRHGAEVPGLRTTATIDALDAATEAGLIDQADSAALSAAWLIATKVRNAIVLAKGRAADVVPTDTRSLAAVGRAMGYRPGHTGDLLEDYRRLTRRARAVHERLFAS